MPINARETCLPTESHTEDEPGCAFILDVVDSSRSPRFCAAPRHPGSAYCPQHHAACYVASGSAAERLALREIEALAEAVGGKLGRAAPHPPPLLLRRLDRIARASARTFRSRIVLVKVDGNAANR